MALLIEALNQEVFAPTGSADGQLSWAGAVKAALPATWAAAGPTAPFEGSLNDWVYFR